MDVRSIMGSALAAGVCGTAVFGACRGGTPDAPPAPPPTSVATVTAPPATSAPVPVPSATVSPEEQLQAAALAASRCEQPSASILNHPDGGVIFNNAMTSADAGFIDRSKGVIDALGTRADAFRCCFDRWVDKQPAGEARVMLRLHLAPGGAVERTEIDARRSNVDDAVTLACIELVAREGSYPESPTGNPTVVEYPFVVGSRP